MYKFYGNHFDSFTVNGEHILCLKQNIDDNPKEISVFDFLNLKNKNNYYLYNDKNQLLKFNIKKVNDNNFYGFELDGNHRYIMGNKIITHNSNGKSKLIELFQNCMGKYAVKFPVTLLTRKRADSNACTPEMARAKGCRFGYLEEPGHKESIEIGHLKELTGGDNITARALHKAPIEFKPQFKLALLCNEIPKVPSDEEGTWRRMEVIQFGSKFCENPSEPNEFAIDKKLSIKLKNWVELFMALLVDVYYVKYKKNGLKVPYEVIKFTLEYQKNCDSYQDFIIENIEDTSVDTDIITITQIYEDYKKWYEENHGNRKYAQKKEFKSYLEKKFKKRVSQTEIRGIKFKMNNETQQEQNQSAPIQQSENSSMAGY
jgi:P4 family phage/plasmid primase-like protien